MNATELFHADGKSSGIYYCGQCRIVHRERESAEQCCKPYICSCGAECLKHWLICDDCRRKKDIAKERERFEKAEKVTAWNGAVADPHSDRYGRNLDELLELLDYDEADPPEYVWTCHERPVCVLDYDTIIEHATNDAYEDFDPGSLDGKKELTEALEKFNALNKENVVWEPNYKLALVLEAVGRAAAEGSADENGGAQGAPRSQSAESSDSRP